MKHLAILLLIINSTLAIGQNNSVKIYPIDDCSEIRAEYNSLVNNSVYNFSFNGIAQSFRVETDTSFLKIFGDTLFISNRTGETYLRLINIDSESIIYDKRFKILKRPHLKIRTDISWQIKQGLVSISPVNEYGEDLSKELKLVYITRHYYDKDNRYLFSQPSESKESTLKIDLIAHPEIAKIRIETLYRWSDNGLCINAEEKTIEVDNDH